MSIYCRESLFKYLENKQADEIFETTEKCMEFYEEFFHFDYPFSKYDHVFCPEFNMGAMENAGAITVNDTFIFKDDVRAERISFRFTMITHELCHMWFGDLVTMRWWNDLWLNESFAEFLSHFGGEKITKSLSFPLSMDVDSSFNNRKNWGYATDGNALITHPIAGAVNNTEEAENIFDGITYSKGASVLKQLFFLMGEEKFSQAMGVYFKKYQWANATLKNFFDVLEEEYKKSDSLFSLAEWQKEWVETPSYNELEPVWTVENEDNYKILQRTVCHDVGILRHHKIKVAFFKEDGGVDIKTEFIKNIASSELKYDNLKNVKAILLNYDDMDFAKVILDKNSLEYFFKNLHVIKNSLNQKILIRAIYDMIRDGKTSSQEFFNLLIQNIDENSFDDVINLTFDFSFASLHHWTPLKNQKEKAPVLFEFCKKILLKSDVNKKDRITALVEFLINFAKTYENIEELKKWLFSENEELKTVQISYYNKWKIVAKVFGEIEYTKEQKQECLELMLKDDKSDFSNEMKIKCKSLSISNESERDIIFEGFLKPPQESQKLRNASLSGFNNENYELSKYHELYFKELLNNLPRLLLNCCGQEAMILLIYKSFFLYEFNRKIEESLEKAPKTEYSLIRFLKEQKEYVQRRLSTCECYYSKIKIEN